MPRSTPEGRLQEIVNAATRVFVRRGFRRTQMADIAGELGVAVGTLYNYAASKEALFHACLLGTSVDSRAKVPSRVPLQAPSAAATRKVVRDGLAAIRAGSILAAVLDAGPPDDIT